MSHTINIRTLIKAKLLTCPTLKDVYDHEPNMLTSWPCATLHLANGTGEFADNRRSKRTHNFVIKVWVDIDPVGGFSSQNAERIALQCLDEITNAFDSDITLGGGTVIYCRPLDYNCNYEIRENAQRVLQMTLETVEIV
jgi:hypothetical protein